MRKPHAPTGFDYAQAARELSHKLNYEEIAQYCGYEGRQGIARVIEGAIPSHPQGEALWVLYRHTFGRKPPMTKEQADGMPAPLRRPATAGSALQQSTKVALVTST